MTQTWDISFFSTPYVAVDPVGSGAWEFYLGNSYDLSQIERITGANEKKFSPAFNRAGSFTCSVAIDSPAALKAEKWRHCIIIQDPAGITRWTGPLTAINDSVPNDVTTLTAQGWQVELDYRWIRPDQVASAIFNAVADGDIAEALVLLANQQTDSDGLCRPTHLWGVGTSGTPRTRTYTAGQNIGAAIKELSDIENGFDIVVHPTTREIKFVPNTSFIDRTEVHYGYNVDPRNVASASSNDDGTKQANSLIVQGQFVTGVADSATSINRYGVMLEDWITISDVPTTAIVGAYANAELVFRADGERTVSVSPLPGSNQRLPFIDYDMGDQVYFSADRGRMQFDHQAMRVFSADISWDSQNQPFVDNLGITPS